MASAALILAAVITAAPAYLEFRLKAWQDCNRRSASWLKSSPPEKQKADLWLSWLGECQALRGAETFNLTQLGFVDR